MKVEECPAYYARLYIAGPLAGIEQCCREYMLKGLCVTVTPTNYIYTGGEQTGAIIESINYARFPSNEFLIEKNMIELGEKIMMELHQTSFSIVTPNTSKYYTREDIKKA